MTGAVPFRIVDQPGEPRLEWLFTDGARFTEPFFEQTLDRLRWTNPANSRHQRPCTALDALRDVAPGPPPAALIFHVSRCGSTLIAQMLAALPRHIVAAEPPIIDHILRTAEHGPETTDDQRIAWLQGAMRSLGQPNATGGERLFVKLDSWHIFALPLLRRAFPVVPFVFSFRDPVEVLASAIGRPGLTLAPGTVTPQQLGLAPEAVVALSREDYAAAVIGSFFRAASDYRAELYPLPYDRLPDAVAEAFPGGAWSEAEKELMRRTATRNAKHPERVFVADGSEKRRGVTPDLRAAAERWAMGPYRRWLEPAEGELKGEG